MSYIFAIRRAHSGSAPMRRRSKRWRKPFSALWRHVVSVWTDVSEDCVASIFTAEECAREEPAWTSSCRLQLLVHAGSSLADSSILKMEAKWSSETSVYTGTTLSYNPENGFLHSHCRKNLKSYEVRAVPSGGRVFWRKHLFRCTFLSQSLTNSCYYSERNVKKLSCF
jgi:hypothetical protein